MPGACVHQQPLALEPGHHIGRFQRPESIAHRDFTPIECLPDDCLLREDPVDLPWRDGLPAGALQTSPVPFAQVKVPA